MPYGSRRRPGYPGLKVPRPTLGVSGLFAGGGGELGVEGARLQCKIRTLEKGTGVRRTASLTRAYRCAYYAYVYVLPHAYMPCGAHMDVGDWSTAFFSRSTSEFLASGKTEKLAFVFVHPRSKRGRVEREASALGFCASGSTHARAKGVIEESRDGRPPRFFDTDPSSLHVLYPKKGDGELSNEKPTYTNLRRPSYQTDPITHYRKKTRGTARLYNDNIYSLPGNARSNCVHSIGVQGLGLERIQSTNAGRERVSSRSKNRRSVRVVYRFISREELRMP